MYELNPERNSENMPPFNHKTALHFKLEKNHRWFFYNSMSSDVLIEAFFLIMTGPKRSRIRHVSHTQRQIFFLALWSLYRNIWFSKLLTQFVASHFFSHSVGPRRRPLLILLFSLHFPAKVWQRLYGLFTLNLMRFWVSRVKTACSPALIGQISFPAIRGRWQSVCWSGNINTEWTKSSLRKRYIFHRKTSMNKSLQQKKTTFVTYPFLGGKAL